MQSVSLPKRERERQFPLCLATSLPNCPEPATTRSSEDRQAQEAWGARRLDLALAPRKVNLLGEGNGGVVVGDEAAGGGVGAGEGDAVVDVEDAVGAAGREDVAGRGDLVGLGVDLALLPDAAARDGRLRGRRGRSVLAEVVGAVEVAGDASLELGVAVVGALQDGELEAAGVLFGPCQHRCLSLCCR